MKKTLIRFGFFVFVTILFLSFTVAGFGDEENATLEIQNSTPYYLTELYVQRENSSAPMENVIGDNLAVKPWSWFQVDVGSGNFWLTAYFDVHEYQEVVDEYGSFESGEYYVWEIMEEDIFGYWDTYGYYDDYYYDPYGYYDYYNAYSYYGGY
jgi:hypothetical protein